MTISPMKTFLLMLSISTTMVSHLGIRALLTILVVRCFLWKSPYMSCATNIFKVSRIKRSYNNVYIWGYIKRKEINKTRGYVSVLIFVPNCYHFKHLNFKNTAIKKRNSFLSHNETTSKQELVSTSGVMFGNMFSK